MGYVFATLCQKFLLLGQVIAKNTFLEVQYLTKSAVYRIMRGTRQSSNFTVIARPMSCEVYLIMHAKILDRTLFDLPLCHQLGPALLLLAEFGLA